ncbi:17661_t:CDS:2 [Dentiscutata erythropus]|uniref:17661_t:CDS:1 n=1 Tax=Dentiscutata erythropus TaxID=1348616 RepID=A0A9N9GMN5_9GLOM|nr:17661_t:CDS:2 [Dentiscutata erythropus]
MSNEICTSLCPNCANTSWCTACNSKRFFKLNWTNNPETNDFIYNTQTTAECHEHVFEFVDQTKFKLEKIPNSNNYIADWEEGYLLSWNEELHKWNRQEKQRVKLITNYYCDKLLVRFLKEEHEHSKKEPSDRLVYGITYIESEGYAVIEKLVECSHCHCKNISPRWCISCITKYFEQNSLKSGNSKIDNFFYETQKNSESPGHVLEWIPGNQFKNLELIDKGAFGAVYKATWENGYINKWVSNKRECERFGEMPVALKRLMKDDINDVLKEVEVMYECRKINLGSLDCYGITQLHDNYLISKRPKVIEGTPECYKDLMIRCWDAIPGKRPDAQELTETLEEWVKILSDDNLNEEHEIRKQFKSAIPKKPEMDEKFDKKFFTSRVHPKITQAITTALILSSKGITLGKLKTIVIPGSS